MASIKRLKIIFSSSSSAAKIAGNDDLLLQILIRLPVKSLMRFKCVSKHWLSLITNPKFSRLGYHPHSPCICGLFCDTFSGAGKTCRSEFINLQCKHGKALSSVNYPPQMLIIQSCNGLLLCSDVPTPRSTPIYYVCNPTTKEFISLSPPSQLREIWGVFLAFDPLKSAAYKVICVRQFDIAEPDYQIEIYSSESGEWRQSEANFSLDFDVGLHGGVFWNDGIHWYTDYGPCFYFDVEEEQIKEMPMPIPLPDDWIQRRVMYFGESRGHLHLIEIYDPPSTQFNVWELQRDYSSWLPKYRLNLDGLARDYPGMIRDYLDPSELDYYDFRVHCIVEGESEEDSYMVLHIPGNLIRYDFRTRNVKKLSDIPPISSSSSLDYPQSETLENFYYYGVHQYIESLASVRPSAS